MDTCACGCGEETSVWARNQLSLGRVKGEHAKWISGHAGRTRHVVDGNLRCKKCGEWKPVDEFYANKKAGRIGRSSYCRDCDGIRARWSHITIKYDITMEAYQTLLDAQGGRCAICRTQPKKRSLSVDHCHDSLAIRGLLCSACNTGLGNFKDSADLLRRAVAYLS